MRIKLALAPHLALGAHHFRLLAATTPTTALRRYGLKLGNAHGNDGARDRPVAEDEFALIATETGEI